MAERVAAKAGVAIVCSGQNEPHGVKVERTSWQDIHTGSKTALIAGGVAKEGEFPGDPGRGKCSCSYNEDGSPFKRSGPQRAHRSILRRSRTLFSVSILIEEAEEERRCNTRLDAERLREAQRKEAYILANLPQSHKDYRKRTADMLHYTLSAFCKWHLGQSKERGYSYDEDSIRDFIEASAELFEALEAGTTIYSAQQQAACIAAVKSATAKADGPMQRMLNRVVAASEGVPETRSTPL